MGNYKEDLENLIELKKTKKVPNKAEKARFASVWKDLVKEEGFTEETEKFLYDGIPYYSAVPFHNYMIGKENSTETLNELYNGQLYGKNCASTVSLLFHLLSLSLNDASDELPVINSLMGHIPEALINKDKKLYGQADRAFKKYLIDELDAEVKFPDREKLLEQGLKKEALQEFILTMDEVLKQVDSENLKGCSVKKAEGFNDWLDSLGLLSDKEVNPICESDRKDKSVKTENKSEKKKPDELTVLCQKNLIMGEQNAQLKSEMEELKNKNRDLEETIGNLEKEVEEKDSGIAKLYSDKRELTSRVNSLEKEQKETKEELIQCSEMLDIIRRNRQKQTDENQRRMASKLKEYYQDYKDAKNLDMSLELGENLRDQFGEVLEILSAAGLFGE